LAQVDAVTTAFLERALPQVEGRLVVLLDSNRPLLQSGARPLADEPRQRFIEQARAAGVVVLDTEPLFQAHFARSRLSLDVGPYDGHLNALGHQLLARAAAAALRD
jgi:hypothetical protein